MHASIWRGRSTLVSAKPFDARFSAVQYSTVLYRTVQYSTLRHTVSERAVLHSSLYVFQLRRLAWHPKSRALSSLAVLSETVLEFEYCSDGVGTRTYVHSCCWWALRLIASFAMDGTVTVAKANAAPYITYSNRVRVIVELIFDNL